MCIRDRWKTVRTWAVANGYDMRVGAGSADNHPVQMVSWYDMVKWCNAKSEKEGLTPYFTMNDATYRTGEDVPGTVYIRSNTAANGYRLPSVAQWEWAAWGGTLHQGYNYSGSNTVGDVAWYYDNSSGAVVDMYLGRGTWPVGQKAANELGLYDMSGNVSEWCLDDNGFGKAVQGGDWNASASFSYALGGLYYVDPHSRSGRYGLRLVRSIGN